MRSLVRLASKTTHLAFCSLPLGLHGRATFRDIAFARLANATAPASCPGNKSELISQVNMKQKESAIILPRLLHWTRSRQRTKRYQIQEDDPARPHEAHHAIQVVFLCWCLPFLLRGRPRCFRRVSCARLASAAAPASRSGKQDFGRSCLRPTTLPPAARASLECQAEE